MKFNENLKRILESKQMKQIQLANLLLLDRTTITKYLSGDREPNLETLKKIKDVLNCTYDDLLE